MSKRRKFLIDCDPGTDDAQAILMALAADDVDVLAITTVAGNSSVDVTSRNALRLLKFCNRMDIPVFKGCVTSLKGNILPYKRDYFGLDGMGDVTISNVDPIDPNLIQSEPAPNAICRIVNENPGSITLVALGPLTNLAICLHLDPHFGTKLGNIVVMGGNYKGLGNASMFGAAEFNWWSDPEAANVLLINLKTMITIVPLETCLENAFEWEFYEKLTSLPSRRAILVQSIDRVFIENLKKEKSSKYKVFDQLAMAVALRPAAAIVEAKDNEARVELHGDETRGQMVVNWYEEDSSKFNIRLVTKVNKDVCKQMLMDAVART